MAKWGLADTYNVLSKLKDKEQLQKYSSGTFTVTTKELINCVNKARKDNGKSVLSRTGIIHNLTKMQKKQFLDHKPGGLFISDNWKITEEGKKEHKKAYHLLEAEKYDTSKLVGVSS